MSTPRIPLPNPAPLVSICLPVHDGQASITEALDSALAQDYPNLEVVVVDDASTDDTPALLRRPELRGRIRVIRSDERLGQARATNEAVACSRGALVKFLHHDDRLDPSCLSELVAALVEQPFVGMAFCRRRIELDADTDEARDWSERYRHVHRGFRSLRRVNSGRQLFEELLANRFDDNWIGEPSVVLVKRGLLEQAGGFHLRIRGAIDLDLWIRLLVRCGVAFVDEELVTYRHSETSNTARTRALGLRWLDRLWMLEGLAGDPALSRSHPDLRRMRDVERRQVFRTGLRLLTRPGGRFGVRPWLEYVLFRAHRLVGAPRLVGSVKTDPVGG